MKLMSATAAALLLGTATLAVAQTRTESFADQFKQMQSLQSVGTYTFKPAPALNSQPTDPVGRQTFADAFAQMQAQSSSSGEWKQPVAEISTSYASADPVGREAFSDMFARMQAASSNSGEWRPPASEGAPVHATAPATFANNAGKPTLAQRIANFFHRDSGSLTQTN